MLSPYSKAQLLGRFCNFLMKSPNFGTPYSIVSSFVLILPRRYPIKGISYHLIQLNQQYFSQITAALDEVAISYHRVRGLYFLAVIVVLTITILIE